MRRYGASVLLVGIFLSFSALKSQGQVDNIVIAAGTPEDHDLQAITAEQDAQKKLAMFQDFVQKDSANPAAGAYGDWQISQGYAGTGGMAKELDYGEKSLGGACSKLDILA